jgi:hypothetical protein
MECGRCMICKLLKARGLVLHLWENFPEVGTKGVDNQNKMIIFENRDKTTNY